MICEAMHNRCAFGDVGKTKFAAVWTSIIVVCWYQKKANWAWYTRSGLASQLLEQIASRKHRFDETQLISLRAVCFDFFHSMCLPQLGTPKEMTYQLAQLEFCCRSCLSWLIAVIESCLGNCILRCLQRLLSYLAFFKVLATERLQLISWWAVDVIATFL